MRSRDMEVMEDSEDMFSNKKEHRNPLVLCGTSSLSPTSRKIHLYLYYLSLLIWLEIIFIRLATEERVSFSTDLRSSEQLCRGNLVGDGD